MKNDEIKIANNSNLIFIDTNILLNDPYVLEKLCVDSNHIVISLTVLKELENLKNHIDLGPDARAAINEIDKLDIQNLSNFSIEIGQDFNGLDIDKTRADNQIISTFNYIIKSERYQGYKKYKLVSEDTSLRLIARNLFRNNNLVSIEKYRENLVEITRSDKELDVIRLDLDKLTIDLKLDYDPKIFSKMSQNDGVIIEREDGRKSLFTRRLDKLVMIKNDVSLFGLKPLKGNDEINYEQLLALYHLCNKEVNCVFIEGKAGTGKTLISLVAALAQKDDYENLIITSPAIPLSGKDMYGFVPGSVAEKIKRWKDGFNQNLGFLEKKFPKKMMSLAKKFKSKNAKEPSNNEHDRINEDLCLKYGFNFSTLDTIRGQTLFNSFFIVDEAQNLSPHAMRTIITRIGEGSKVVFCGDLKQIDNNKLSANSSGLAFAMEKMTGTSKEALMVASCTLIWSVRSKLVEYASRVLKN